MALTHTPAAELGRPAPDFDLPGTDGKRWTLADVRGASGTLVMFICNHCPYVQAIRERLVADLRDLQAQGIGVVAISSNDAQSYPEDSFDRMRATAHAWGFTFPYLYDESQAIARAYGAVCTPDFFGYDKDSKLAYRGRLDAAHRGPRTDGMQRELVDAMREIARGGATTVEQVPSMGCNIKWKSA